MNTRSVWTGLLLTSVFGPPLFSITIYNCVSSVRTRIYLAYSDRGGPWFASEVLEPIVTRLQRHECVSKRDKPHQSVTRRNGDHYSVWMLDTVAFAFNSDKIADKWKYLKRMETEEVCHAEITAQDLSEDRQHLTGPHSMVSLDHHHSTFNRAQHEYCDPKPDSQSKGGMGPKLVVPGLNE